MDPAVDEPVANYAAKVPAAAAGVYSGGGIICWVVADPLLGNTQFASDLAVARASECFRKISIVWIAPGAYLLGGILLLLWHSRRAVRSRLESLFSSSSTQSRAGRRKKRVRPAILSLNTMTRHGQSRYQSVSSSAGGGNINDLEVGHGSPTSPAFSQSSNLSQSGQSDCGADGSTLYDGDDDDADDESDQHGPKTPFGALVGPVCPNGRMNLVRMMNLMPQRSVAAFSMYVIAIISLSVMIARGCVEGWGVHVTHIGNAFIFITAVLTRLLLIAVISFAVPPSPKRTNSKSSQLALRILVTSTLVTILISFWELAVQNSPPAAHYSFADALIFMALLSATGYHISAAAKAETNVPTEASKIWREAGADIISRLSVSWMNPLIDLAARRPLTEADLWDLDESDVAESIYRRFKAIISAERSKRSEGYLIRAILKLVWKSLAFEYSVSILDHLCLFANPLLIHRVLSAIQDPAASQGDVLLPVFGLFVASVGRTACESQLYWINRRLDARIRAALVGAVFEKNLRRMAHPSSSSTPQPQAGPSGDGGKKKSKGSDGTVTNLISADTDKILACFRQSHYALSVPLLLALCFGLLSATVGFPGAIAGITALALAVPITDIVGKKIKSSKKDLLNKSDDRIFKLGELLKGFRTIKLLTWEPFFGAQLKESREAELRCLSTYLNTSVATQLIWRGSPLVASAATFLARALFNLSAESIDAASAFTVLVMYNNVLRYPLFVVPKLYLSVIEAGVSTARIEAFFAETELERFDNDSGNPGVLFEAPAALAEDAVTPIGVAQNYSSNSLSPSKAGRLGFHGDASFTLSDELARSSIKGDGLGERDSMIKAGVDRRSGDATILRGLNLEFAPGKFTVIVGATGCGKSAMLLALLGELRTRSGQADSPLTNPNELTGSTPMAYVAQQPWLQNASIRDNILFDATFDPERYKEVLSACALVRDLEELPLGDLTEVGERGVTLSGGQKQRICLARAIYSHAPVLLLDDVLSAVDAQTARHILKGCLCGPLTALRTRILVTNAVDLCLPAADDLVILRTGGTVVASGLVSDVIAQASREPTVREALEDAGVSLKDFSRAGPISPNSTTPMVVPEVKAKAEKNMTTPASPALDSTGSGYVPWVVYRDYFAAAGGLVPTVILLTSIVAAYVLNFMHEFALKAWADNDPFEPNRLSGPVRLALYILAAFIALLSLQARFWTQIGVSLRASESLHDAVLMRLLNAPVTVLEATQSGKVMNRLGKDLNVVDVDVVASISETVQQIVNGLFVLGMVGFAAPILVVGIIPIAVLYYPIAVKFLAATRSLKRLENGTRSPIFTAFNEALAGATTIRAFKREQYALRALLMKVDDNHKAFLPLWAANRWLAFRVELVGALVALAVGTSIAASRTRVGGMETVYSDAGWSGLVLSYASMFTDVLTWLIRNNASMEMTMTSVERLREYTHLPQEAEAVVTSRRPPTNWPASGGIVLEDLVVRYKAELPPALSIPRSVTIKAGSRVGIVGRTGSGKTTMGMSLLRLIESERGSIKVDNIDINDIGLPDLRSNVVTVPQDPFLFKSTLRANLDPLGIHSLEDLNHAVEIVGLSGEISLDSRITEDGSNLSSGQRQLVSIARAIVRLRARGPGAGGILVLDEATASLDTRADMVAQKALRSSFSGTVVTIAHRLRSVASSDVVLVLSGGEVVEMGSPRELMAARKGFWELCVESGDVEELERIAHGRGN